MNCWYDACDTNKRSRQPMPLIDRQCRAAKPAAKVQKLADGRGHFLQVTPGGSRFWHIDVALSA